MKWSTCRALASLVASFAAGALAWRYAPLGFWEPAFPAMLVAMSMLGAAVLVRLARNAPITAPAAFDEEDLRRFFDALETLAKRLFAIFVEVILTISSIVFALVVLSKTKGPSARDWIAYEPWASALMTGLFVWVLLRLVEMTYGDIGFIRLQRHIIEHALERERNREALKKISASVDWKSSGDYGRAINE